MFRPHRHKQGVLLGVILTSFKLLLVAIIMAGAQASEHS